MKKSTSESANSILLKPPQWRRVGFLGIMVSMTIMLMALSTTYQVQDVCQDTHILSDTECTDTEINNVSPQNFSETKHLISTKEISYTTARMGFSFAGTWDFLLSRFTAWFAESDEDTETTTVEDGISNTYKQTNAVAASASNAMMNDSSYCECTEMIYLNEVNGNGAVHKFSVSTDGTLTEIGAPWFDNAVANEGMTSPHGLSTDLNGSIYIGETSNGNVRKFSCNGEIVPGSGNDGFRIEVGGTNFGTIGNLFFTNGGSDIGMYDICTGDLLGSVNFCELPDSDWGFYIDPRTNEMYATAAVRTNRDSYFWHFDMDDFDSDPNTCINSIPLTNYPGRGSDIRGVVTDVDGNVYIVVQDDDPDGPSFILKYGPAPTFTYIGASAADGIDDGTGYNLAIGIVYSETANLLYVSTESTVDDCIAVFDTSLNYLATGVPSPGGSTNAKGIAITTECCPKNSSQTLTETLCVTDPTETQFLNEIYVCEGVVCEAPWEIQSIDAGLTYTDCDQSLTGSGGCAVFTKSSDGSSGVCGPFDINMTVCIYTDLTTPAIAVTDSDCDAGIAGEFTVTTPCDAGAYLEWSLDGGVTWSTTAPTYDTENAQTVITRCTIDADGSCLSGVSASVTSVPEACTPCEVPNCDPVPTAEVCQDGTGTVTLNCDAGLGDVVWYNSNGDIVGNTCDLTIDNSLIGDGSVGATECFYYQATDANTCSGASCCPVNVSVIRCCDAAATAFALSPSCTDGIPNNDGYLQISAAVGTHYDFTQGSTYTGGGFAGATPFDPATDLPLQFNTGLSNADAGTYTIRVFDGADDCFTDVVVTLNTQNCTEGCDCQEYLYSNDTDNDLVHKFLVNPTDSTLIEVGNPWFEPINKPHGGVMDLNGVLYFAEKNDAATSSLFKIDCDGNFIDTLFYGDFDGTRFNNFVMDGNILYVNGAGGDNVKAYDICEERFIGTIDYCCGNLNWELFEGADGNMYTTDKVNDSLYIYNVPYDTSLYNGTVVLQPVFKLFDAAMADRSDWGVETDLSGNWYVVLHNNAFDTRVLKYDASGTKTGEVIDLVSDGVGFFDGRGVVWSEATDLLYVASDNDDCVAVIAASSMTYLSSLSIPGGGGKDLSLVKECCPINNNVTIDTTLCTASLDDVIFLQDLTGCDGPICEGVWQEGGPNTGLTYDPCDNSITIDALNACGSFTLESDGVGNNSQCGAFNISINICVQVPNGPDKDGDGVADVDDLDDDNDGILDVDEDAVLVCSTPDLSGLDGGPAANSTLAGVTIGAGASITLTNTFTGGASQDEDVINNSQTTGVIGIRQGVANSPDATAQMINTYTFSDEVCNLTMGVFDIDRTDILEITAFNNGTPVTMTVSNVGNLIDVVNGNGTTTILADEDDDLQYTAGPDYAFDVTFDQCVDEVVFTFNSESGLNNQGGSYSVTFGEGCTQDSAASDTDGDGIINSLDLDSDNDGIPDAVEACGDISLLLESCSLDFNGDGAYINVNANGCPVDGVLNNLCASAPIDTDGDGTPDFQDLDSDGDGCSDAEEAGTNFNPLANTDDYTATNTDVDICGNILDGAGVTCDVPASTSWIDPAINYCSCPTAGSDKDNDGVPDYLDVDDDNDGILDVDEGFSEICSTPDLSGLEGGPAANTTLAGVTLGGATITLTNTFTGIAGQDEDIINNSQTTGALGIRQGVLNSPDATAQMINTYTFSQPVCNLTMNVWDIDRTDILTITANNNGTPVTMTVSNVGPLLDSVVGSGTTTVTVDEDDNLQDAGGTDYGFVVSFDACVDEVIYTFNNETGDNNQGGSYSVSFNEGCSESTNVDTDLDGIPDHLDLDSDNDGIPDAIEACGDISIELENCMLDNNGNAFYPDLDGDDCPDGLVSSACPDAPVDTDGDGIEDFRDLDSDGDGCSDAEEAGSNADGGVNDPGVLLADTASDAYDNPAAAVDICGLVEINGTALCYAPLDSNWIDDTKLCGFDLALAKTLSSGQSPYVAPGDTVSFDIVITNQGFVEALRVLVNDYVPAGYTFDPLLNPLWDNDSDGDGNPDYTIAGPIAAQGGTETLTILLIVDAPFTGTQSDLVNYAEISAADDDNDPNNDPPVDEDSTPDTDPVNDPGGTPDGPDDDFVDGDGLGGGGAPLDSTAASDEDDQDPAFVTIFDLALAKTLSSGQSEYIAPGDDVSFEITVTNQGTVDAYDVLVTDYIPAGYTLNTTASAGWVAAGANAETTIAGPLAPGASMPLTIVLTVNDPFTGSQADLVNYAEISAADDDEDDANTAPTDYDSTPDTDPANDAGGTPDGPDDDYVDGDGTNGGGMPLDSTAASDEDDQDPAYVSIFDLALAKTLSTGQSPYIAPGDDVSFDIEVFNQGTLDAYDILVNDYVPAGYTFDAALNPTWNPDSDGEGNPDQVIPGPLAPGASMTLTIVLSVPDPYTATQADLVNYAEISAADDDTDPNNTAPTDADSTPDTDPVNDAGGTPDGADDDFIDGDGSGAPLDGTDTTDEDDQDPAYVTIFDLALAKTLSAGQSEYIAPGDNVSFDITVTNQGTVDAYNVLVNDYVPAGYTFNGIFNAAWNADSDGDGNPDQEIAGPIAPGGTEVLTIVLTVNDPFTGSAADLVNYAEISAADDDTDPNNTAPTDADSTPDTDPVNDAGGTPDGADDDFIDGDGSGAPLDGVDTTDEDDQDPAYVNIFDMALAKTLSAGQSPYIAPGDDVSFDVTVTNQGTVDAYNVLVNDYVPAGYTFDPALNVAWNADSDGEGNPDQVIAGPMAPGDVVTLTIVLSVPDPYTATQADLVNYAEISAADDDTDPNNTAPTDADSTPDTDPVNDAGGTPDGADDDFIDGDGSGAPLDGVDTTDEDDQDPAYVTIFDLALAKTLSSGQTPFAAPGDTISFDIEVFNQGTVEAFDILVNDYVPAGYTFDPTLNTAWNADSDSDGNPDQTIAGPLAPGDSEVLTILLTIIDPFVGDPQVDLINYAEISAADDNQNPGDTPPTDADSTPDTDPANDAGGTPDGPDDDYVDGDGLNGGGSPLDETAASDEDDQDPAYVSIFDLALTKMLSPGQDKYVAFGDTVSFDVTVINQAGPAYNILVNDYVPVGYTFDAALNPAWGDADADGNPDQSVFNLPPGADSTMVIILIVNDAASISSPNDLVNYAEISAADDDTNPNNTPPTDPDSTPDNDPANDAGGTPDGSDDDFVDGDGTGAPLDSTALTDEDDQDPAYVMVFDLALAKTLSASQSPYIAPGDDVSFDIEVSNQGVADAYNILVNDYVPAGYTFDTNLNAAWSADSDGDGNPDQTIPGPLASGASMTLTIVLSVNDPFTGSQADLVNYAEISAADDDMDPGNTPPTDADSTPDTDPANDAGGTPDGADDDFVDGDGSGAPLDGVDTTDEDDQDPAYVTIFDLALAKTLSSTQSPYIAPGDDVSFDIEVTNQGTVDAYNVLVNDYVPAGYTFDAALNPTWNADSDGEGNPDQVIPGPLAPGASMTLTIVLSVPDPYTATQADLVNYAEISAADDDTDPNNTAPTDADSTPDTDPVNDAGGTPDGADDDFVDGDGTGAPLDGVDTTDEDDQDPAYVTIFDLALAKTLSATQSPYIAPGDDVSFDIEVTNQGTVEAFDILVNDYVPAGYTFAPGLNAAWSADSDSDGNPDQIIPGPLAPGASMTLTIVLSVNDPFTGTQADLVNYAEISAADDDMDDTNDAPIDYDSTPDTDPANDAGGTPDGADDDFVDGDGSGAPLDGVDTTDEDDQDPAYVTIFDLALAKTLSAGQSPYIAPGDDVSFDIEVTNQGTVDAYNILVNDYVPVGYTFDAALNPTWNADSDGEGNPDQVIAGPMAPGDVVTLTIVLSVPDPYTATQADLVNYAEISAADDDTDPNNTAPTDADSTPDTDPVNDAGGTPDGADDDFVDGDGTGAPLDGVDTTDEDDQDPAYVTIFDLALAKTLSPGQTEFAAPGDTVSFDIEVFNQGTVEAFDILVNDYVPAGYTFDAALNPAWNADSDGEGNPDQVIAGPLAPGGSQVLTIQLIILDPFTANPQTDLTNYAEISAADDNQDPNDTAPTDADSTPDTDPTNDPGGTPDGPDDDYVDGDGLNGGGMPLDSMAVSDEDDQDPAYVTLFDLALTKMLSPGQSNYVIYGDTVTFDITVYNQAGPAYNILVNDYVPVGYTFDAALNPAWADADADGNPDQSVFNLAPGADSTMVITLIVNDVSSISSPTDLVNYAEISDADDDTDPTNNPPVDSDSTPDNDPTNDAGGTPDGPDDDFVDGDGLNGGGSPLDGTAASDEDDQDPAFVDVFDLALQKTLSPGQSPYIQQGGTVSYDITVYNQGTVDAVDILVNDYVPTGLSFDAALNATWGDTDADGNPDTTIAGPLAPGGSMIVTIILSVDNPFTGTPDDATNYAEISSADDDGDPSTPAPPDADSTPDNDPVNDPGGTPDGPDDDFVDGDGLNGGGAPLDGTDTTDEDDQDPVTVEIFDLALQKRLSVGQDQYVAPGDVVSFDVTVSNQGFVDAYNVLVNDYVPSGYTYDPALNLGWGDTDADGNPDRIIAGPIIPGGTSTVQIQLIVNDPYMADPVGLVNYAEITAADDDQDPTNDPPIDFDSTPDNDISNDAGGTPDGPDDDYIDGDGSGSPLDSTDTTDEDDQDPAFISIFDLALAKTLTPGESSIAAPGQPKSFDITVTNQGSVAATDILVNDYVPSGYTFDPALNAAWGDTDADGNPDQVIAGPLAPNGTMTLTILLTVNDPFVGTAADLVNYAEISSADDDGDPNTPAPDDVDSTPDNDVSNDPGGTPNGPDDDYIDGDGTNGGGAPLDGTAASDEDDQDPVFVDIFDVALTKELAAGQSPFIAPGDTVTFAFTLYNQGTTLAWNTLVNDYVPAGMTFDAALNTQWGDADLDGNPDRVIVGPLAPGGSQVFLLTMIVNDPFVGTSDDLINYAEIASSDNDDDTSTPAPTDIDSTPDNDVSNDAGGTPDGPDDDYVDGNGTGMPLDSTDITDEDDQDPALVNIFDMALAKMRSAGQGEYIAPGDNVSFDIVVTNQGTADAYSVLVNDYVPAGYTFDAALNPTWSADSDGDGNPDITVAGPIAPNGGTETLTIILTVNDPFTGTADDLINYAEISEADNDTDPNNTPPTDYDSTPDTDPANDPGGTPDGPDDDYVDGDGTGGGGSPLDGTAASDEDDQDPAYVNIFDLALAKTLSAGQSPYITPGDNVSFDITVTNQGTVDGYNILVNDYVPAGMTYDAALNAAWGDTDADGNPDQVIAGPLAPGGTMMLTIVLTVNDPFTGTADDLVNYAEISDADDDTDPTNPAPTEADSTPDNNPTNDAGGTPDGPDDDFIDGDGTGSPLDGTDTTDEDDQDPAFVSIFDLALAKTLSAGQSPYIAPGDNVSFDITVYNQGTVDAVNVLVNDYVPAGYTFDAALNAAWGDADADGNPDQTIAGPIAPGGMMPLTIVLTVNDPFMGTSADLVNYAEISDADDDGDPNTPAPADTDSTPNNDPADDAGGTPDGADDDYVDGDGSGAPLDGIDTTDEDDQDPAFVNIFDLALAKTLSAGQNPYITPGDNVSFDITVTNQGTVDAYNVLVNDYVPAGMTFDPAANPAWGDADADGNPDTVVAGPIVPGGTETLTIVLTVNDPFTGTADDLVNYAEISDADDDTDPTNTPPTEADSTPDNDPANDAGGTPDGPDDDFIDGDGTGAPLDGTDSTDEDDQDPAYVSVFDMALSKTLSAGQGEFIAPGDMVSFDITVTNQGTVDAYNVLVNDYIPAGMSYDAAANPAWGDADADGNPDQTIAGPIAPNGTMMLTIVLTVNDPFTGTGADLVNVAEISDADDDTDPTNTPPTEADSTPDNDPANDAGGEPDSPSDDVVDGDGSGAPGDTDPTTDEDDQDPAFVNIFDLALTKTLSAGQSPYISAGEVISYDITVYNQGTTDAYNVLVNDYVPAGLNFDLALNPMWGNADADANPDQIIAGPLAPGASQVLTIMLTVDDPFTGTQDDLINYAEISSADDDTDPTTPGPDDIDSTPNNDPTDDPGGTPQGPDDDYVDGDGTGTPDDGTDTTDEDDHDPEFVTIFDLAFIKTPSLGQDAYVSPGDQVSFDLSVINQGLTDAYNVLVNDYVPNGYTYDPALNPGWGDSDADGNPDRTIIGPIIPGGTVTSTIVLTVNDPFDPSTMSLVNYGEISEADDDLDPNNDPPIDTDSTPNNDPTDDAGGTPDGPDDDFVDGDGTGTPLDGTDATDEDDQDPASVGIFDLALTKALSAGQSSAVGAGDNVSFDIVVYNQGTVDAYDVLVNDYVPSGYTFDPALNAGWADSDLDGNPDQNVAGPLAPGTTTTLTIVLTVNNPFSGTADDLTNVAEIGSADDDGDDTTPPPADVDSTPDNDPNNDPGGTPDGPEDGTVDGDGSGTPNDGDPTTDEDDADPATVDIFDMALSKTLSPGQSQFVAAGDTVSFDITLFNQGTIDAQNILVNDYVPAGYTFDPALNSQWGDSDLDGNPDRIITGPLLPGTDFSFEILLIIDNPFTGTPDDLVNVAEISDADDDGNPATPSPSDIDSTPDNDDSNDAGGTVGGPDDDYVDGNGSGAPDDGVADTDEDDSDPATVVLGGFDLALTKTLSVGQSPYIAPGDNVSFDITVSNQGAIDAYNVLVNDYVPAGMSFDAALNPAWTDGDADGNPDQTIAGPIAAGAMEILTIVLTVNDPFIGTAADLVNYAEISEADNDNDPTNTPPTDTDSTPDNDDSNDAGGAPDTPADDSTAGDGSGAPGDESPTTDEDDADPAAVYIFDLALQTTLAAGQPETVAPGDDVTFDITVYNQGTVDAESIQITDYIPPGYIFDPALNPDWTDTDADGNPDQTINTTLTPGSSTVVQIVLTVDPNFAGTADDLVNEAEISAADDDTDPTNTPPTDIDSVPDNDNSNDAGGLVYTDSDDVVTGDGTGVPDDTNPLTDEDDADPAAVGIFDLALQTTLAAGQPSTVAPGDDVTFDITVYNQGTQDAESIQITDYIPAGYIYDPALNPDWTDTDGDGNPDQILPGILTPGASTTVQIVLTVDPNFAGTADDLVNEAEISAADNDNDPNNTPPTDVDSVPDTDNSNDAGGLVHSASDDVVDGDGTGTPDDTNPLTDEDDADPAAVGIFDLALTKAVSAGQATQVAPGDTVSYDITITNQGTVDAYDIEVNDYTPTGMVFNLALNPGWGDTDANGIPEFTIAGPLAAGTSQTVSISLVVANPFDPTTMSTVNYAEIGAADDDGNPMTPPPTDADSTPDDDPANDAGGTPNGPDDDATDGDGSGTPLDGTDTTDEDDADPAAVSVSTFDLALMKMYDSFLDNDASTVISPGDDVRYTITVYNQGTVDATDVVVTDYIPTGMMFMPFFNPDFSGTPPAVTATIPFIAAGGSETVEIILRIDPTFNGFELVNNAEITSADDDGNPNTPPPTDEDSVPGDNENTPSELNTDNNVDDDCSCAPGVTDNPTDNDDYDPARIEVEPNLPIQLSYFKGTEEDCEVVLSWGTESEINFSHFEIEKSTDGVNFSMIDRVDGLGAEGIATDYTYTDTQTSAVAYYRLKQVDLDGSFEYSEIVTIQADCASGISISDIFPNPTVNDLVNVRFNSSYDHEDAKVIITDMLGRTMMEMPITVFGGSNLITVDPSRLPAATYVLSIQGNNWRSSAMRFVKLNE